MSGRNHYEVGQNRRPPQGFGPGGRPPMGAGEKPKDFKKSISELVKHTEKYKKGLIAAIVLALAGTAATLAGPDMLRLVTDEIVSGLATSINLERVVLLCVVLLIIFAVGALLSFLQGWIITTVTQRFAQDLRAEVSRKINRLPLKHFDRATSGDILSRVTNDVDTIATALNQSIGTLAASITLLIGSLILMLITNVLMAITAVVAVFIGFILMGIIMGKSQKHFVGNQKNLGDLNGHIEEMYAGHTVVRAYNAERGAISAFDEINDRLYTSNWKSQFMSGLMMPFMGFIGNLGFVAVCVVGAVLVINESISFGVVVAFMLHIRNFTQPLGGIAQSMTAMQSAAAASERVFEFLKAEEMANESAKAMLLAEADVRGDVDFCNVVFGYNEEKTIIKNFSASIKAGQKVAIVGPTGAGKTTIVNLLMRFYETNSGEIKIDGVPISEMTRENVHALFCMVLQDTWLFEGTIKENVIYSKSGVTDEEVKDACKAVGVHHFIRTLPSGYDTVLGENINISAGEKQLLTIARAMIENAPLLILDEATSSVDTRTEVLVQRAMAKLTEGRTSFVIAHRLSTIRNADVILVMRDGDIIESGSHDELISKNGFYAELYNSQFEDALTA
ncbi:MAG: ABC transporter ATP-binding protein/permease [Oscillospiraceae bacterium]|nr:ABC transporter ATP-binding protein/permease [Oscillospiraceae bacterium]